MKIFLMKQVLRKRGVRVALSVWLFVSSGFCVPMSFAIDNTSQVFSEDTSRYVVIEGDTEKDIAFVHIQGGPSTELMTYLISDFLLHFTDNPIFLDAFWVNVHQAQTYHTDWFTERDLTFGEVKEYTRVSIDMLYKVVSELLSKEKTVYLVGFSYGAFLLQEFLVTYGNIVEGSLIGVGRLDIQDKFWKAFSQGHAYLFDNGTDMRKATLEEAGMVSDNEIATRNMPKLAAATAYKRYTKLLAHVPLDNVVYIYGLTDEQVGRMSEAEIQFLRDKHVKKVQSEFGHLQSIQLLFDTGIDLLVEGNTEGSLSE